MADEIKGTGLYGGRPLDRRVTVFIIVFIVTVAVFACWKLWHTLPIVYDVFMPSANRIVEDGRLAVAVVPEEQKAAKGEAYTGTIFLLNTTNEPIRAEVRVLISTASEYTTGSLTVDGRPRQPTVQLGGNGHNWELRFELTWQPAELHIVEYGAVMGGPGALVPWGSVPDLRFERPWGA